MTKKAREDNRLNWRDRVPAGIGLKGGRWGKKRLNMLLGNLGTTGGKEAGRWNCAGRGPRPDQVESPWAQKRGTGNDRSSTEGGQRVRRRKVYRKIGKTGRRKRGKKPRACGPKGRNDIDEAIKKRSSERKRT